MTVNEGKSARGFWVALSAVVLILVIAGALAVLQRRGESRALAKETDERAVPTVSVVHPTLEAAGEDLVLPATLQAYVESPIYARTSGYLKKWYFDIGSEVKEGALLAEIDAPEVDQELAQARATRQQTAVNLDLAKSTAERWAGLRKSDSVSQQEADEKKSAYTQLQATLAAVDANVHRLEELESFKRIYAPFSGVITKRSVDIGTLVAAGTAGGQLFHLSQTNPIRVYASVPEANAAGIHPGLKASVELPQYPGVLFPGPVVRTSHAIDPSTRTLLAEVEVANPRGELMPGGYAQVHFAMPNAAPRLQVPVNALLFRAEGVRAAVVDANHRVHLRALTIGRDFGTSLEVISGLAPEDWIILNPADSLDDNQEVRVAPGPAPPGGAGGSVK